MFPRGLAVVDAELPFLAARNALAAGDRCYVLVVSGVEYGTDQRQIYAFAAAAFLVGVPGLSAGPHLRQLASRRSHALLPHFCTQLLIATALLLVTLSVLLASLVLVPLGISKPAAIALSAALLSGLFWFGFLPGLPRFLSACALVGLLLARVGNVASLQICIGTGLTAVATLLVAVISGWLLFGLWLQRRISEGQVFPALARTALHLPLALSVPGRERIGTASGTLLLGSGDARSIRLLRALLGIWLVPAILLGALVLLGQLPLARALGSPVLWLLALSYSFGFFMYLAQRVGERRALLWLRVEGDWLALQRRCVYVLVRELALWAVLLALAWEAVGWAISPAQRLNLGLFLLAWIGGLLLQAALQLLPNTTRSIIAAATASQLLALASAVSILHVSGQHWLLLSVVLAQAILTVALGYLGHRQFADPRRNRRAKG